MENPYDCAPVPRRAALQPATGSRPSGRAFLVTLANASPQRIEVNGATALVLNQLLSEGAVAGGDPAIARAVRLARAAGVAFISRRISRTDGGTGHIALYTLAEGTKLESQGVHDG